MKKICVNVLIASMFALVGLTNVLCNNKEKDKLEYVETNKMSAYNDLGRTFFFFNKNTLLEQTKIGPFSVWVDTS